MCCPSRGISPLILGRWVWTTHYGRSTVQSVTWPLRPQPHNQEERKKHPTSSSVSLNLTQKVLLAACPSPCQAGKGPILPVQIVKQEKVRRHAHPKLCTGLTIVSQGSRVSETCPNHIAGLHTLYGRFRHAYEVVSRSPSHDSNTNSLLPAKLGMLLAKGTCG